MARGAGLDQRYLLILPAGLLFVIFMIIPLILFFVIGFNPSQRGIIEISSTFTLDNFVRFFSTKLFLDSLRNSLLLGVFSVVCCILLGYPLAFILARTSRPRTFLVLVVLVLAAMQLDMTVRLYGLTTIFGNNNGLVNQLLAALGLPKIKFLYNMVGVTIGTVQFTLPFMIFTLVGVLRNVDVTYEHAARSLGASWWIAFRDVTLPLSLPAIVAGSVIVFALAVAGYLVPALLGASRIPTLAIHLYQQVNDMGFWQFGASIGLILFTVSFAAIVLVYRFAGKSIGV